MLFLRWSALVIRYILHLNCAQCNIHINKLCWYLQDNGSSDWKKTKHWNVTAPGKVTRRSSQRPTAGTGHVWPVTPGYLRQPSSSEASAQSMWPSQWSRLDIHLPLPQWNSTNPQGDATVVESNRTAMAQCRVTTVQGHTRDGCNT